MDQREHDLLVRVETLLETVVDDIDVLSTDVRGKMGAQGLMARVAVLEDRDLPSVGRRTKKGGIVAALLTFAAALAGLLGHFITFV